MRVAATAAQPSTALGTVGFHPVACLNAALLTRCERITGCAVAPPTTFTTGRRDEPQAVEAERMRERVDELAPGERLVVDDVVDAGRSVQRGDDSSGGVIGVDRRHVAVGRTERGSNVPRRGYRNSSVPRASAP